MERVTSAFLFIGVFFLLFTFINAYLFLREDLSVVSSSGFVEAFGDTLAPLTKACIRVIYLGVMGWIGSIMTLRGMQLLTQVKVEAKSEVKPEAKPEIKPEAQPKVGEAEPSSHPVSDG